ncbi:MAG: thiamine-phosphate kinase, partial [Gemmatimonadota bacterium]
HGAALLGGDLARGGDAWMLDVVAAGRALRPVLRSGARPGDALWITGALGGAASAVRAWTSGAAPRDDARARFVAPVPRLAAARALADRGLPSAMLDISDGLVADAGHLAAAGGVALEIDAEDVPVFPGAERDDALAGGEDYELLFTAAAGSVESVRAELESAAGAPLRRIGRVAVGEGVRVFEDGRPLALAHLGYDHFRDR